MENSDSTWKWTLGMRVDLRKKYDSIGPFLVKIEAGHLSCGNKFSKSEVKVVLRSGNNRRHQDWNGSIHGRVRRESFRRNSAADKEAAARYYHYWERRIFNAITTMLLRGQALPADNKRLLNQFVSLCVRGMSTFQTLFSAGERKRLGVCLKIGCPGKGQPKIYHFLICSPLK